jgi:hypothetical protein
MSSDEDDLFIVSRKAVADSQCAATVTFRGTVLPLYFAARLPPATELYLSKKTCKYDLRVSKSSLCLTKFLVNTIHIYDFKLIY